MSLPRPSDIPFLSTCVTLPEVEALPRAEPEQRHLDRARSGNMPPQRLRFTLDAPDAVPAKRGRSAPDAVEAERLATWDWVLP